MNKIREAFSRGKAFSPFITCGDPDLETTAALVRAAQESGADLIELGIPFSDPTAEGPVIQSANARALAGGVTTDRIFAMVKELRQELTLPLVFMTYANVIFSYGAGRQAKGAGVSGTAKAPAQAAGGIEGFAAKAVTSVVVIILNYVFSKLLVFRGGGKGDAGT